MRRPYIIAEIGVDHEGDPERFQQLIIDGISSGADCIKTQIYAKGLRGPNRELPHLDVETLIEGAELCEKYHIRFALTPHDEVGLRLMTHFLGYISFIKIGSGHVGDFAFLEKAKQWDKPLVVSTGMHSQVQLDALIENLDPKTDAILHCVSEYPVPLNRANLQMIQTIKKNWKGMVGYSDHTETPASAIVASIMGIDIIERHLTLKKNVKGRQDTFCSSQVGEFRDMVQTISDIPLMMGGHDTKRERTPGERDTLNWVRKRNA